MEKLLMFVLFTVLLVPSAQAHFTHNVMSYGCAGNGSTDDTACFNATFAAAGPEAAIYIPEGNYLITAPLNAVTNQVRRIFGDGQAISRIIYAPTASGALFTIQGSSAVIASSYIEKLSIQSDTEEAAAVQKTAIFLKEVSNFTVRDVQIYVDGHVDDKGLQIQGRHESLVDNVSINAAMPLSFERGPNDSLDHWTFSNLSLYSMEQSKPLITVEPGLNLSNIVFEGRQVWVGGDSGFYWNSNVPEGGLSSPQAGVNISFSNVRWENGDGQGATPLHGYMFYMSPYHSIHRVAFINCTGGSPGAQGFYLRRNRSVTFQNVGFGGTAQTLTELDIDASNDDVTMIGCHFSNSASAAKIIGLERIVTSERKNDVGNDFFGFAHYAKRREDPSLQGQWLDGVYTWRRDVVVANGASVSLPIPAYVGPGQIRASVEDSPAGSVPITFEHCTWGVNYWGAALLMGTSRCGVGTLPNAVTITYAGAFNPMTVTNTLGIPVRIVLSMN